METRLKEKATIFNVRMLATREIMRGNCNMKFSHSQL